MKFNEKYICKKKNVKCFVLRFNGVILINYENKLPSVYTARDLPIRKDGSLSSSTNDARISIKG